MVNNQVVSGHLGKGQAQPTSVLQPRAQAPHAHSPCSEGKPTSTGSLRSHSLWLLSTLIYKRTIAYRVGNKELEAILQSTISELSQEKNIISHCKQLLIALLVVKAKF